MAGPRLRFGPSLVWQLPVVLLGLASAWVFLDLYLRVDLPGAALMAHMAFRCLVGPLEWLTEGEGLRLQVLLGAWAGGAVVSTGLLLSPVDWLRSAGRIFWLGSAIVAGLFVLLTVSLGVLMERALAAGYLVAVVLGWLSGGLESHRGYLKPYRGYSKRFSRVALGAALTAAGAVGVGATYYIYALFMTYGEGYPLLDFIGSLVRDRGVDLLMAYSVTVASLGVCAGVWVFGRRGDRVRRPARLLAAAVCGVMVALALDRALTLEGPWWSSGVILPAGLLMIALVWGTLRRATRSLGGQAGQLAAPMVISFVLALLCVGHAYAARIFRCPDLQENPYLTRIASLPEVFRVTLFARNRKLAVSIRAQRRLGWVRVLPLDGVVQITAPGPANLGRNAGQPGNLAGVPEDFVYAPALDRFYVSLTANETHLVHADTSVRYRGPLSRGSEINNMIITVTGDASRVLDVLGVPGLCWLNCMRWNDAERLLYLGCEDRPGLFRYDPHKRIFRDGTIHPSIGDVQDIAFDARSRKLFTVSLWKTAKLTELDWKTLKIKRQLTIGGSHYDVVHSPRTQRIFASAWYGSRIRMIDAQTFKSVGSIPTGLGTRALAIAGIQNLLLASSVYDGRLRICNPGNGKTLASIPVGGHVKDIAIDEERGLAYFWSQCGLFRLKLDRWSGAHAPKRDHSSLERVADDPRMDP